MRPLKVFLCHSSGDKPIVRDAEYSIKSPSASWNFTYLLK